MTETQFLTLIMAILDAGDNFRTSPSQLANRAIELRKVAGEELASLARVLP